MKRLYWSEFGSWYTFTRIGDALNRFGTNCVFNGTNPKAVASCSPHVNEIQANYLLAINGWP